MSVVSRCNRTTTTTTIDYNTCSHHSRFVYISSFLHYVPVSVYCSVIVDRSTTVSAIPPCRLSRCRQAAADDDDERLTDSQCSLVDYLFTYLLIVRLSSVGNIHIIAD